MSERRPPTFGEAFRFWLKLGLISFGGPGGQIAIMHAELVEKRRWISETRFLHALNYCMLLPGPEATQLATYIGWLLHRTWGGLVAGGLFVLPSVFILWGLSLVYVTYGKLPWVEAIFYGLKPAVLAIIAMAVMRLGTKVLKNVAMWGLAAAAFVGIYLFNIPFPFIVLGAATVGWLGGRIREKEFLVISAPAGRGDAVLSDTEPSPAHAQPTLGRAVRVTLVSLLLWWLPVLGLGWWLGWNHTLFREGLFFSKAAMVTFGGAYAVLPYVAQQTVETYGWLQAGQMLDGLALAETTPGPLIMVLQFVGFVGAWQHPGTLTPLLAATLGALITTWTTFVPCFLWIFLGAPYVERLRGKTWLSAALSAVTAAVVGVILNLGVSFGRPVWWPAGGLDGFALGLSLVIFLGMWRWQWGIVPVVLGSGAVGLLYRSVF